MRKKVVVLLADGFEETETITTIDILRRADIRVTVAGVGRRLVVGCHDISILADKRLSSYKGVPDAVVLPGGVPGVNNLYRSHRVRNFVRKAHRANKIIAAICAAPGFVLAPLGILRKKRATCYPGCDKALKLHGAKFIKRPVVIDGNIITSRGPGTAFDFALTLVEKLAGKATRKKVQKKTLYEK